MKLSEEQMYARFQESDATCNGAFWVGVMTTGIYCLPSCHARKALRKNVRFFPSIESACAAKLRPCQQCYPDDFARGQDPLLEQIETLAREVRQNPCNFSTPRSLVRRSGFGATRLFELFREHYHVTPGEFLLQSRLAAAQTHLVEHQATVSESAWHVGFRSLSTFHEHFRRRTGLSPSEYQRLGGDDAFTIRLPKHFSMTSLKRSLGRDPGSVTERLEGDTYAAMAQTQTGPAWLKLKIDSETIDVFSSHASQIEIHDIAVRLLGLRQEPRPFASLVAKMEMPQLIAGRREMRISQTPSVFDGLVWSIIGQQIAFPFAALLRSRLTKLLNEPFHEGLYAPPTPKQLALLDPESLLECQFSKQKTGYLIGLARTIATGQLELEALSSMSATRVMRTLLAIKGLGPWSVNYVMMRSLGFLDCVPLGDTGVTSALERFFGTPRPGVNETKKLMVRFSPFRSLATAHLWQFPHPANDS